jgi:hypothetical protein
MAAQSEQAVSRNKRRKIKMRERLLLTDYECLSRDEAVLTISEIRQKLTKVFKHHIGKENSISPHDLFVRVFDVNPNEIDVFKRNYWWVIIKKTLASMRGTNDLFVINKGSKLFVLQTREECKEYKERVDRHIHALHRMKENADAWVREKKYISF